MLAFSLQFFGSPHESRSRRSYDASDCYGFAPQGQFSKSGASWKIGGAWVGHGRKSMSFRCNYYHSTHRRMCSLPLLLGPLVLLGSIGANAAVGGPPTDPPEKPGSSGSYAGGDNGGERDASGGFGEHVEANTPASKMPRILPDAHQSWLRLWQQGQQQPRAPGGHAVDNVMSPWKDFLNFLDALQQDTSQNLVGQSPNHPPAKVPQVQSNIKGTSSAVVPGARRPVMSQQLAPKGKEPPANTPEAGNPSEAGVRPSSEASQKSWKPQLSWLSTEGQQTEEEAEEEALADAIIHGTSKKRVPRVRTAVDALVEAIEEEKLQRVAKTPRQLEHLRQRRKADMQARKSTVQMPEYFVRLAKEAAAFHKQQAELEQRKKNQPVGPLGERLRTLALRQYQKDKLLTWREGQIFQMPEDEPNLEKQIAEARKTDRELARTLLRDLSKDELEWATGAKETQEEEASGNVADTAGEGKE